MDSCHCRGSDLRCDCRMATLAGEDDAARVAPATTASRSGSSNLASIDTKADIVQTSLVPVPAAHPQQAALAAVVAHGASNDTTAADRQARWAMAAVVEPPRLAAHAVPRVPLSQPDSTPAVAPWPIPDTKPDPAPLAEALADAARLQGPRPNPTKEPESASQTQLAASAERRVALVIGNSEYRSAAFLPNPRRDAKAVADALRQVGFQSVELAMDLDRDAMVKALRTFRDQADKADWALIYFAGHGIEINRINYLIPVDAKLRDDRDVKAETVSYEELLDAARGARMLRLLVLDACRVNPFKDSMRRSMASRGSNDRGLAPPPEAEAGTMVVYSAKDGEVAADDVDGVNSPFARAFVAELKVPGREVRRLFDYVRDDVLEATNNRQQPFTYGSLPGRRDFYFVAKMNPPSQPPMTAPPTFSLIAPSGEPPRSRDLIAETLRATTPPVSLTVRHKPLIGIPGHCRTA
jgi:hypothetical protein